VEAVREEVREGTGIAAALGRAVALGVFLVLGALAVFTHGLFNAVDPYVGNSLKNPFANVLRVHVHEGMIPSRSALSLLGLDGVIPLAIYVAALLGLLVWAIIISAILS